MSQSWAGRRRAAPCRDASMTAWEHTRRTAGFAATIGWSKVRTSAGRMAIANVSQTCGPSQGSGAALAAPEMTVSPLKHSGAAGQRATAPRSVVDVDDVRVAGQPPGCRHLAEEPPPVTFGKQYPVADLYRDFPAH